MNTNLQTPGLRSMAALALVRGGFTGHFLLLAVIAIFSSVE
jgi:hypothetical protein